jgi:hypothetical protein
MQKDQMQTLAEAASQEAAFAYFMLDAATA